MNIFLENATKTDLTKIIIIIPNLKNSVYCNIPHLTKDKNLAIVAMLLKSSLIFRS